MLHQLMLLLGETLAQESEYISKSSVTCIEAWDIACHKQEAPTNFWNVLSKVRTMYNDPRIGKSTYHCTSLGRSTQGRRYPQAKVVAPSLRSRGAPCGWSTTFGLRVCKQLIRLN